MVGTFAVINISCKIYKGKEKLILKIKKCKFMKKRENIKQISKLWLISLVYIVNLSLEIFNKGIAQAYTTVIGAVLTFMVLSVTLLSILTIFSESIRIKIIPKIKKFTSNIANLIYLIIILLAINFYGEKINNWVGIIIGLIWCTISWNFIFKRSVH